MKFRNKEKYQKRYNFFVCLSTHAFKTNKYQMKMNGPVGKVDGRVMQLGTIAYFVR